ncbi:MAG: ABC transporter permease [Spirochaetales bacterium]|nr:ABC transporter permease [Spirochaetales bacterium]
MKTELLMAFKNGLHNPGRTFLTMGIIMVSLAALLFVDGYVAMVRVGFAEQLIRQEYGHFQIYPKGFESLDDPGATHLLFSGEEVEALSKLLYSFDEVTAVLPRLPLAGMVGNSERSLLASGFAGNPIEENLMARGTLLNGSRLEPGNPYSAVVGVGLAKALHAQVGDLLTMIVPNAGGGLEATYLEIHGIADYGPEQLNRSYVETTLENGRQLLFSDGAQRLVVLLGETKDTRAVMEKLQKVLPSQGLEVEMKIWTQLAHFYTQVIRDYTTQIRLVLVVVLILGALAVSNTISISVLQRYGEIGTLRAIGISSHEIMATVLLEGLFLGLGGSLLGILFTLGIQAILNVVPIFLPPPPGTYEPIRLSIMVQGNRLLVFGLLYCFITIFAALPPAFRGTRINIIKALRG